MIAHVDFRIVQRDKTATCESCKALIAARGDGRYEVSPHLREKHGFVGDIEFEQVATVICPPMIVMRATSQQKD